MSDETTMECVERGSDSATASVVWLHGLGADGHDFVPIVPELRLPESLDVRFVFPHADHRPVTLNAGMVMRAWYDIVALDLDGRSHDKRGIRASAAQIDALIAREQARGVPAHRIVVAGFSQGGALAIHVALRSPERLAGLVALSCYTVLPDSLRAERTEANARLPVFGGHGELDPVVPVQAGRLACDTLRRLGHDVEWNEYPVPHSVHPREIADVARFLTRVLCE